MLRITPHTRGYLFAVLGALAALLLRQMLSPLFGSDNPYLTAWAAVVFSAWYCGIGPSVVCLVISVVGIWYWFLPVFHSFRFQDPKGEIFGWCFSRSCQVSSLPWEKRTVNRRHDPNRNLLSAAESRTNCGRRRRSLRVGCKGALPNSRSPTKIFPKKRRP